MKTIYKLTRGTISFYGF